jgi:arsenate reductase (thioredoxin)
MLHPANPRPGQGRARPRVLFLCTGNSCRSQIAEGWARHLLADVIEPFSAGTSPHGLNPLAVRAMAESGVDIRTQTSKHVDSLSTLPFDLVITVCDSARETCPVLPGAARTLHAPFEDPPRLAAEANARTDDEALPHYRRIRDEIRAFILTIPAILNPQGATP